MEWTACVGIDWADQKHSYAVRTRQGEKRSGVVSSSSEELHGWVRGLRAEFPEGRIVVGLEQGRGSLIDALIGYDFLTIIPINPRASKAYRESRRLSGSSSDPVDAELICEFTLKHLDELRVWQPDEPATRKLRGLVEARRTLVDQRTAQTHQLSAVLKGYFPQALQWFNGATSHLLRSILRLWPTLSDLRIATAEEITGIMRAHRTRGVVRRVEQLFEQMRQAVPLTNDCAIVDSSSMYAQALVAMLDVLDEQIDKYDQAIEAEWAVHPDRSIFDSLPGAGPVIAPRLAVAFGTDRSRYQHSNEVQCYSGIAPVTEESGKYRSVHARWGYPTFMHQSFHEFAASSLPHVAWANASYRQQRERGAGHHAAIRAVAFRWIRILFRLWKDRIPYDDQTYRNALARRNSPLVSRIAA
jgi:transposase